MKILKRVLCLAAIVCLMLLPRVCVSAENGQSLPRNRVDAGYYSANYGITYISLENSEDHGSAILVERESGETLAIEVIPEEGYGVSKIDCSGRYLDSDGVAYDCNLSLESTVDGAYYVCPEGQVSGFVEAYWITVQYESAYPVTLEEVNTYGSVTLTKVYDTYVQGETVSLAVSPKEGYILMENGLSVTYDDGESTKNIVPDCGVDGNPDHWTFLMPAYPVSVSAAYVDAASLPYIGAEGPKACDGYFTVTAGETNWESGWYAVQSDVTVKGRITASGDVNLILCEGVTLTAEKGIETDGTLTIYVQEMGNGRLTAKAPENTTAISGNVTIYGGVVEAYGGNGYKNGYPGGVGGQGGDGIGGDGKTVKIYGGKVTAKGGDGGQGGTGSDSTITYIPAGNGGSGGQGGSGLRGGSIVIEGFLNAYGGTGGTGGKGGNNRTGVGGDGGKGGDGGDAVTGSVSGSGLLYATPGDGGDGGSGGSGGRKAHDGARGSVGSTVSGSLEGVSIHQHSFTYTAAGSVITAVCGEDSCTLVDHSARLTLELKIRKVYRSGSTYRDTYTAHATGDGNLLGWPSLAIVYQNGGGVRDNQAYEPGEYEARMTLGGATATLPFEILKHLPPVPEDVYANPKQILLADVALPGGWEWDAPGTELSEGVHAYPAHVGETQDYRAFQTNISVNKTKYIYQGETTVSATVDCYTQKTVTLALPQLPRGCVYPVSGQVETGKGMVASHSVSGESLAVNLTGNGSGSVTIDLLVAETEDYLGFTVRATITVESSKPEYEGVTEVSITTTAERCNEPCSILLPELPEGCAYPSHSNAWGGNIKPHSVSGRNLYFPNGVRDCRMELPVAETDSYKGFSVFVRIVVKELIVNNNRPVHLQVGESAEVQVPAVLDLRLWIGSFSNAEYHWAWSINDASIAQLSTSDTYTTKPENTCRLTAKNAGTTALNLTCNWYESVFVSETILKKTFTETVEVVVGEFYTVSFAAGYENPSGSMEPASVVRNGAYELPVCGFTREGYVFSGWKVGAETRLPGDSITVSGNVTVTAQWALPQAGEEYHVSIADGLDHGTAALSGERTDFGKDETVALRVVPEEGYQVSSVFVIWLDNQGMSHTAYCVQDGQDSTRFTFLMPACPVTVFAQFADRLVSVSFIDQLGWGDISLFYVQSDKLECIVMSLGYVNADGKNVYSAWVPCTLTDMSFRSAFHDELRTVVIPEEITNGVTWYPINERNADGEYTVLHPYPDYPQTARLLTDTEGMAEVTVLSVLDGTGKGQEGGCEALLDGLEETRWNVTEFQGCYVEWQAAEPAVPSGYTLTTGDYTDARTGRNPRSWTLKARQGEQDEWVTLADVSDDGTLRNVSGTSYAFAVDNPDRTPYQYFRFEVSATQGADVMQLSGLSILCDAFKVSGEKEYTIWSPAGWDIFCDLLANNDKGYFNGKTVKLGTDIGTAEYPLTRMAGGSHHDFTGTFDGCGHTLTIRLGSEDSPINVQYASPFAYVENGCVIRLIVKGSIYTSAKYAGGLVGVQYGKVELTNCRSSVTIYSSVNGDGTHGGLVGLNGKNSEVAIEGCVFDGKILSVGTGDTTHCSGFVGYRSGAVSITNSVYDPAAPGSGEKEAAGSSATFVRNGSAGVNCYYTRTLGEEQGKKAYAITAGEGVALSLAKEVTEGNPEGCTEYKISGITAYGNNRGLKYGKTIYAGQGESVRLTLTYTGTPAEGNRFDGFFVNAGTLDEIWTEGVYTLTMPAANVTVLAAFAYGDEIGARLVGHSIALEGEIGINFYMELSPEIAASKTAYVLLTVPSGEKTNTRKVYVNAQSDGELAFAEKKTFGGKEYYLFKCSVAAKDMGSVVRAQAFDGDLEGREYTYSVKEYAEYLLANAYEADGTTVKNAEYARASQLVTAMLQYGAAAQAQFGVMGTPVNENCSDNGWANVTAGDIGKPYDMTGESLPAGTGFAGATLSLKAMTTLSLYFTGEEELTFSCDGMTVEKEANGGYQVARIRNIPAPMLRRDFTLRLGGDAQITYSPMTYCYNVLKDESQPQALRRVAQTLYLYAVAAEEYFAE